MVVWGVYGVSVEVVPFLGFYGVSWGFIGFLRGFIGLFSVSMRFYVCFFCMVLEGCCRASVNRVFFKRDL